MPRMSSTPPYTMSPTWSSAGGLNGRTRATRFAASRSNTPGVDANTSPFRSYVPSPGSNSSATAIWSPGRTIFRSMAMRISTCGPAPSGARYLSLPHGDAEEEDRDATDLRSMERERVRDRELVRRAVRDPPSDRLDPPPHVRLGLRVQEHVHDAAASQADLEERPVRVAPLGTKRRVHEDRVEPLADVPDVGGAPLDLHVGAHRIPPGGLDPRWIDVHPEDASRSEQLRGDPQDPVPASCV